MDLTFREPVVARVRDTRGKPALLEIRDVRDGLAALNRYGLGSDRCGTTEWQSAASQLVRAALHPSSSLAWPYGKRFGPVPDRTTSRTRAHQLRPAPATVAHSHDLGS